MGLQINKALTTSTGDTIASGSVAIWSTKFVAGTLIVRFQPVYLFKNVADRDAYIADPENAQPPYLSAKINDMLASYDKVMTVEEQGDLETNSGAFSTVEGWLKDAIVANSNGNILAGDIAIIA